MPAATPATVVSSRTQVETLARTARLTGLFYLGLAVTGGLGFLLIRTQLYVPDDPQQTLAHLVERQSLARIGIALELGIVVTQALTAVWFRRLFRAVDPYASGALAAFGLVNATAILASAAMIATALEVALDPRLAPSGDSAATAQLMYAVSTNLWGVGALFFGLWLIPMGSLVLRSGWMPRPLGWILVAGGVGYVLSAFVNYLAPDASVVADVLTWPASVGEFWMIAYLLIRGVRRSASGAPTAA